MPKIHNDEIITAVIEGLEVQKARLDAQIAELRVMLSGRRTGTAIAAKPGPRKRRKLSAAARARIAEAQRKRWATLKRRSRVAARETTKSKRRLSAAGKAAIVAALKKRRAAKRAEAAKAKVTASKKGAA